MKQAQWLACVLLMAAFATAQAPIPQTIAQAPISDKGLYGGVSYGTSYDDSLGWTSLMSYSAGYETNRHVSVESGIPFWLVATTDSTAQNGTTKTTQSRALGDLFVRLNLDPKFHSFGYRTSFTGTAPTGDTKLGLSTGRAGILWGNHIEKDAGFLTPFGEFSLSNTQGSTPQFQRSYTVLGKSAAFRGGANMDLTHRLGFEASFYDVAPFGTQKVYSRIVARGTAASAIATRKGRPFASQAVTVGDASIAADHGFNAGISFDPSKRVDVSLDYNRSIVQSLDSVGFTIAYRFGHLPGARSRLQ